MAAVSNLKNMLLCLSGICLVCGAILACSYAVTLEPIEAAQVAKTNKSVSVVLPPFEGDAVKGVTAEGVEYYSVEGVGVAVVSNAVGFGGTLSLMVGIDIDGRVCGTTVLSHSETPGLGAKCKTDSKFIGQFEGLDPALVALKVRKDGGDIDAITGSTITSRAYTLAVENALKVYGGLRNE